ncbi:hypothetical protein ZIOFF_005791 [Zingiber officinale]|uniref:Uncharacterized protein n=1 Tax=Zingiber officinale TaxID=94328 RepID=A0A8J5LMU7_ZINOF|nr:hypothetical protein ZIOFF_005791 [Zingiber officinale]
MAKSQRENDDSINYAIHPASTTHLSISVLGNHSSDFSLKLSTGNPEQPRENNNNGLEVEQLAQPSNKGSGWVSHGAATIGGPLAEALRSSTSTHSPTNVLHKPNGSMYEIIGLAETLCFSTSIHSPRQMDRYMRSVTLAIEKIPSFESSVGISLKILDSQF